MTDKEEIKEYIESLGFETDKIKPVIDGKRTEFDIVVDSKKLAIEYCGLYWHSQQPSHGLDRGRNYHFQKFQAAESLGYRLLTIFEDEWTDRKSQIKAYIRSCLGIYERTFYARKLEIRKIDAKTAKRFYDTYHWQGGGLCKNSVGLFVPGEFLGEELLGCMSFSPHHRFSHQTTLNRLCFKADVRVIGGSSRMLTWLRKECLGKIISWSDNRYSQGKVYQALGFTQEEDLGPDYSYTTGKPPYIRKSKQSMKKSNTGCPKHITENDWAIQHGWFRIWDCGKKRWVIE